jgi:hypothetical protein
MPLAHGNRVEPQFLRLPGRRQRLLKPVSGADESAGDRVLDVGRNVKKLKPHDANDVA